MTVTLKAARVNKGLTQEEAARSLSVSKDTLRNWEKAKTFPNVQQIKSIEALYGIEYDDIIFLPDDYA